MSTNSFKIDNVEIGEGHPTFIIAEIGVNHNGSLEIAKKTIDSALEAGADCVKFQSFRAEEFMADKDLEYEYTNDGKIVKENMYEMFKRLELPASWHKELFEYSRKLGLVPMTSVADPLSTDIAMESGITCFKLSSEDLINLPLIEYVASKKMPMILSTGMADEDEVADALEILKNHGVEQHCILHCVSVYPTPNDEANLSRLQTLKERFGCLVGYSDHTEGILACTIAAGLGACILEKHFTLDKGLAGPDHSLSADPQELKALVSQVREAETMRGISKIAPSKTEMETRMLFRRSVVAVKNLEVGHIVSREDLSLKRPGTGLKAKNIPSLLGKKLKTKVARDTPILIEHLED